MRCPRCDSQRIQRDYDNALAVIRLAGLQKLLCNNCGRVFHGFDPLRKLGRVAAKRDPKLQNRRRGPRYSIHLPTSISLIQDKAKNGKVSYSAPSHGHCEAINEFGMGLSLVGSRFPEAELSRAGCLLLIRIRLPQATVEAVVAIKNHHRIGKSTKRKWYLGVEIKQISPEDKATLAAYLSKRAKEEPWLVSD